MQIKTVQIKNLRSLEDVSLKVQPLTALIGGNNAGKSTIQKAIEIFFEAAPKLEREDFTVGGENDPIEITIGFDKLTSSEVSEFGSAVISGELIVTRRLSLADKDSGQYSARALVYPDFRAIREEEKGTAKRTKFNHLAKELDGLEAVTTVAEVIPALVKWEKDNLELLVAERVRGFFGTPNVANGKLRKKTSLHFIPAVRDTAAEMADPKRSPIISLLSEIAKQTFENRKEMVEFVERTKQEFALLSDPALIPELSEIGGLLTDSLQQFYADSEFDAHWEQGTGLEFVYPAPRLKIVHSGTTTDLSRVGHGLQRAALFSIVQFLAERKSENNDDVDDEFEEAESDIILLIEEPEIYQHPSKQLAIYEAFKNITSDFNRNTGIRVQIIYSTHSEKFVRMSDFEIARIVKRPTDEDDDVGTKVSGLTIEECSKAFAAFHEPPLVPMSNEAFVAKLHIFTREVCEGFFATKVILVEGLTDKAVLEAVYRANHRDVHQESLSIISVEGKSKMDKPAYVFTNLGIPTYMVFDNDHNKAEQNQKPQTNILLQKVCDVVDPVEWPDKVESNFTAIEGNLEKYLQGRLGDLYDTLFNEVADDFGLTFSEIKKTPAATAKVLKLAQEREVTFPLFDDIIKMVDELKRRAL
ncbi:MAG: hypothetical protein COB36_15000 [Alphaproteobacteria bacterium]|nr:MAG: hypothetical protein COB36_15000 [Alphaproteobacteria bacterium]